jgi:hypothetical protein
LKPYILMALLFLAVLSIGACAEKINVKSGGSNISVDCPDQILIQRDWANYMSFSVNNSGRVDMNRVSIFADGRYAGWIDLQTGGITSIKAGEKRDFMAKILVPAETKIGDYNFTINVNSIQIDYSKDITLKVFNTRDDMLLYQIQEFADEVKSLRSQADDLEKNQTNMTYARSLLDQAGSEIRLSQDGVKTGAYSQVTQYMREIEQIMIKARFEISNPTALAKSSTQMNLPIQEIISYSPFALAALAVVALAYFFRKIKIKGIVRAPNLTLRQAVVDDKRVARLDMEIEQTKESQRLMAEEYSGGMISRESYDELRLKYQERLMSMEIERKKLRGY